MSRVYDLVVEHLAWITAQAHRYCRVREDAEDLLHETVYKLLANEDKFKAGAAFKPWALAVMENTFKTWCRRRQCVSFVGIDEGTPYRARDRTDALAVLNEIEAVMDAAEKVSVNIRSLRLYIEGYTYDEIAEIEGINAGTVRSRIANGRRYLKARLTR